MSFIRDQRGPNWGRPNVWDRRLFDVPIAKAFATAPPNLGTHPTVLVDMDGPLADFDAAFFDLCEAHGLKLNCTPEGQTHRFATDHLNRDDARYARALINNTEWFENLPVTEGAYDGIHALSDHYDVWVCTKPLEANRTCRDAKAHWLREHFGEWLERRLIVTPDKSLVRGAVLLDDAPKRKWFERAEWTPVIFPRPWNRAGSQWADLPAWTWGDDPRELVR